MQVNKRRAVRAVKVASGAVVAAVLSACGGGDGADPVGLAFSVGGKVAGLADKQTLRLQNNGGDDLEVSANGDFTFATQLAKGAAYAVTITRQPAGQTCVVEQGTGTTDKPVDTVRITCANASGGGSETAQWIEAASGACVTYPAGTVSDHASTNGGSRMTDSGDTVIEDRGVFQFAGANCTGTYKFVTGAVHTYTARARYSYEGVPIVRLSGTIETVGSTVSDTLDVVWWMPSADRLCDMKDTLSDSNEHIGELTKFASTETCLVRFTR